MAIARHLKGRQSGHVVKTVAGENVIVANVVRMYGYYLGDSENTDAGREAVRLAPEAARDLPSAAVANREFLKHAVRVLERVARICKSLCPGSYPPISRLNGENQNPDALGHITGTYSRATAPLMRTTRQISQFFSGFELIEPALVYLTTGAELEANTEATNDADFLAPVATRRSP